ncbi:MAG: hypothetical protein V4558_02180 [Gemmatimonadota bacterium]
MTDKTKPEPKFDKAKEEAKEEKAQTIRKQHAHDAPETRNTENRGRTASNRGK